VRKKTFYKYKVVALIVNCLSAHNSKTTGPILNIQTVLKTALRGEGPIFLKTFLRFFFFCCGLGFLLSGFTCLT
jgi:hypothetical protein